MCFSVKKNVDLMDRVIYFIVTKNISVHLSILVEIFSRLFQNSVRIFYKT